MPLCTLPAPHRTSSPYNHRLLETLNLNGLPFVSPTSTENVRRLVRNVTRQLGAPVAAQRALGLGLTNHFHEPRIHQPLPTSHSWDSILPRAPRTNPCCAAFCSLCVQARSESSRQLLPAS